MYVCVCVCVGAARKGVQVCMVYYIQPAYIMRWFAALKVCGPVPESLAPSGFGMAAALAFLGVSNAQQGSCRLSHFVLARLGSFHSGSLRACLW